MKRESSEGYISDKSSSNEAVDQVSCEASERAGRLDAGRRAGQVIECVDLALTCSVQVPCLCCVFCSLFNCSSQMETK